MKERKFFTKFNSAVPRGELNSSKETKVNPHGFLSVQEQVSRAYSAGLRLESWRQGDYDHYDTFDDTFVEPPAYSDPDFMASTDSQEILSALGSKVNNMTAQTTDNNGKESEPKNEGKQSAAGEVVEQ